MTPLVTRARRRRWRPGTAGMDACPECGSALPYGPVLRRCILGGEVAFACPSCKSTVRSGAPLLGFQVLWIGVGAVLISPGGARPIVGAGFPALAALSFWIASFWIAAPWLCRFRVVERPAIDPARGGREDES